MADIIVQGNIDDTVVRLLNNSGGALAVGDVVVVDPTTPNAVTTTVILADLEFAGVVKVGGANGSIVKVLTSGKGLVNVDLGGAAIGDWLRTSTVTKTANSTAINGTGLFGIALENSLAAGTINFIFKKCFT